MKKLFFSCIVLTSLVFYFSAFCFAASIKMGDVDGDGKLSAKDARHALRHSVELEILTDVKFFAADVDSNKKVNSVDARKILRASVDLETMDADHIHNHSEKHVVIEPTCSKEGSAELICICGHVKYEKLDLLEHDYTTEEVIEESTCTKKGTMKLSCDCGDSQLKKLDLAEHEFKITSSEEATCKNAGYIDYECVCGEKKQETSEKLPHDFDKWKTTTEPTCTTTGQKTGTCSFCSEPEVREIPALMHDFADGACTVCEAEEDTEGTIPKLYFIGDISNMYSKSDVREIDVTYSSKEISFAGSAKLKVQGTSSLAYDKKNYTINFYEDRALDDKMKVDVGWGKQNKYCLKANWIDKTHARNIVTADIAAEIQQKYELFEEAPHNGTIDGFPIEVYINGDFLGIYTFNIPKDAWMFNMDEDNPDNLAFCGEAWYAANLFEAMPDYTSWEIEVGEENDYSLERLSELFDFIINSSDDEFIEDFGKHLNLDATLNYYILTEFAFLADNVGKNMILATYDGKIWYPSLYDLDSSWGADYTGKDLFNYEDSDDIFGNSKFWKRVQTLYYQELADRYAELRNEILTKEHIIGKFKEFGNSIPSSSMEKELEKWGTEIPGFEIEQISEYLDYMIPVLDHKYDYNAD